MKKTKNNDDQAHIETDEKIEQTSKKIEKKYKTAYKDLKKDLTEYLSGFDEEDKLKRQQLADGKITELEYVAWKNTNILLTGDFAKIQEQLAEKLSDYDREVMQIIKESLPEIYALNMNYATYSIEKSIGYDTAFKLYDKLTVERIIRDNPSLLPDPNPNGTIAKRLIEYKRLKWNRKNINSVMVQGIIAGESVKKIANNLQIVTTMNKNSAIRNARTMATSAENAGREESYTRAQKMGIKLDRIWVATLDDRTRHEHRLLDGQIRKIGEPFEVNNQKIRYPGDPKAPAHLVYNCRCKTIGRVSGIQFDLTNTATRRNKLNGMTYEEWKNYKVKNEQNNSEKGQNRQNKKRD